MTTSIQNLSNTGISSATNSATSSTSTTNAQEFLVTLRESLGKHVHHALPPIPNPMPTIPDTPATAGTITKKTLIIQHHAFLDKNDIQAGQFEALSTVSDLFIDATQPILIFNKNALNNPQLTRSKITALPNPLRQKLSDIFQLTMNISNGINALMTETAPKSDTYKFNTDAAQTIANMKATDLMSVQLKDSWQHIYDVIKSTTPPDGVPATPSAPPGPQSPPPQPDAPPAGTLVKGSLSDLMNNGTLDKTVFNATVFSTIKGLFVDPNANFLVLKNTVTSATINGLNISNSMKTALTEHLTGDRTVEKSHLLAEEFNKIGALFLNPNETSLTFSPNAVDMLKNPPQDLTTDIIALINLKLTKGLETTWQALLNKNIMTINTVGFAEVSKTVDISEGSLKALFPALSATQIQGLSKLLDKTRNENGVEFSGTTLTQLEKTIIKSINNTISKPQLSKVIDGKVDKAVISRSLNQIINEIPPADLKEGTFDMFYATVSKVFSNPSDNSLTFKDGVSTATIDALSIDPNTNRNPNFTELKNTLKILLNQANQLKAGVKPEQITWNGLLNSGVIDANGNIQPLYYSTTQNDFMANYLKNFTPDQKGMLFNILKSPNIIQELAPWKVRTYMYDYLFNQVDKGTGVAGRPGNGKIDKIEFDNYLSTTLPGLTDIERAKLWNGFATDDGNMYEEQYLKFLQTTYALGSTATEQATALRKYLAANPSLSAITHSAMSPKVSAVAAPTSVQLVNGQLTINSTSDNDNITVTSGTGTISVIQNGKTSTYANGLVKNISLTTSGANSRITINAGIHVDELTMSANNATLNNNGQIDHLESGNGNIALSNNSSGSIRDLILGNGVNTIVNKGDITRLESGDGQNNLTNNNTIGALLLGRGDDNVVNTAGARITQAELRDGNNALNNAGSIGALLAGAGNDQIVNKGSITQLETGSGNNTIDNYNQIGAAVLGNGNDTFSNQLNAVIAMLDAGDGDNTVVNYGTAGAILAKEGKDTFKNYGTVTQLDAGNGNNTVLNSGATGALLTGTGIDTITNTTTGRVSHLDAGNGNNTLLNNGAAGAVLGGSGFDKLTNNGSITQVSLGDGNNGITNTKTIGGLSTGQGADVLNNTGTIQQADLGDGNNGVDNSGTIATLNSGSGADFFRNRAYGVINNLIAGAGVDSIQNDSQAYIDTLYVDRTDTIADFNPPYANQPYGIRQVIYR